MERSAKQAPGMLSKSRTGISTATDLTVVPASCAEAEAIAHGVA